MNPFDLKQLEALTILLEEQSVSKAARRLGVTPPAVSRSLSLLRGTLNDPLLVAAGRNFVLTPYAQDLRRRLSPILQELRSALGSGKTIDPSKLTRTFRISAGDYVTTLLAGDLFRHFSKTAPGVTLIFQDEEPDGNRRLQEGSIDLEIHMPGSASGEIVSQKLLEDRFVCAFRRGILGRSGRISLKDFCAIPHLVVSRRGKTSGLIDTELAKRGMSRRVIGVLPGFGEALRLAGQIDCILVVPETFLKKAESRRPLEHSPLPIATPKMNIMQSWHPRFQQDAAHLWLRDEIRKSSMKVSALKKSE